MYNIDRIARRELTRRKQRDEALRSGKNPELLNINNLIGFGGGGEASANTDPYIAYVDVLMHFNGTNGSTTFTDEKGHTATGVGNAQISTTQSKFGGASLALDGSGDYVYLPSNSDWNIGLGDYTIEFQFYANSFAGQPFILNCWESPYPWGMDFTSTNVRWSTAGGTVRLDTAHNISTGAWVAAAVSRQGTDTRVFINGTQKGSTVTDSSSIGYTKLEIGAKGDTNSNNFDGYIDELRISTGICRYTSNYTPQTAAFPDS